MEFDHVTCYKCSKCNYNEKELNSCESCKRTFCQDCVELVKVRRKLASQFKYLFTFCVD